MKTFAFALIALFATAAQAQGNYTKACGTLSMNEFTSKVTLNTNSGEVELENLSTIAYSEGHFICVSGYEDKSFSGKKTIKVMIAESN